MSRNCINWITAKIYKGIFAESLQVMNIEDRIGLLGTLSHLRIVVINKSVKAKIYS